MKILLCVHHRLDVNTGAPGVTLELGAAYRALGHEVAYLSFDDLPAGVRPPLDELIFPAAATRLLDARRDVDVIDASTGDAWLWARLRRNRRAKLITRSHGLEHVYWESVLDEARVARQAVPLRTRLYHGGWRLREVAASLRAADGCIFLNPADLEYATERLGVRSAKCVVLPNGIPPELTGRPLSAPSEPPAIAMIGSWSSRKGVRYAAAALTQLLGERRELRLRLLGTQSSPSEVLAAFPPALHPRINVVVSYDRAQLPDLLAGTGILLSAALAEGFGLGILEGMALGLAPVSTSLPGPGEFLRDGENGLLVPPRDADALRAATERLLDDRPLLERLRQGAHAEAQRFTWSQVAERNVELYERAISGTSGLD